MPPPGLAKILDIPLVTHSGFVCRADNQETLVFCKIGSDIPAFSLLAAEDQFIIALCCA